MIARPVAFVLCVCVMLGNAAVTGRQVTVGDAIKASDVQDARDRINTLRTARSLSAVVWTDPSLAATTIKAAHQLDARSALAGAYSDDGLAAPTYTNPLGVGDPIRAADLNDLLAAILAAERPVIKVNPIAYSTVGNTLLRTGGAATSAGAFVQDASGVGATANVIDPLQLGLTFTLVASLSGGVTMLSDGTFTYNPPAGFTGSDSFMYKASNASGDTIGTVNLTVGGMVWFVDNSFAGATKNGTSANPFDTLKNAESSTVGSGSSAAGDEIFLFVRHAEKRRVEYRRLG